ncbi:unnamed protein product [Fraxinus pennsylvanica]|uniref:Uncharacterized protein n=1 Tax=Fraxinus pennsylvanica TaxID=56036 RepID=A0AAD2DSA6_9LAMI|nr:unnamed protein product [Fraxinus pennsylvanica]
MNARGGLKLVLQLTSNHSPMAQRLPMPMPNGYGTVRSPHRRWQFGMVTLAPSVMVDMVVFEADEEFVLAVADISPNKQIQPGLVMVAPLVMVDNMLVFAAAAPAVEEFVMAAADISPKKKIQATHRRKYFCLVINDSIVIVLAINFIHNFTR